jgi:acyl-CoA thioesterase I
MRRQTLPALALALAWLLAPAPLRAEAACPPAPAAALALPGFADALATGREIRIIALGSSSTAGVGATAPRHAYPAQLEARLAAARPGAAIRVLNRGVGGEDAEEMLARLDEDVLYHEPALVIWQVGVNAALRQGDPARFAALLEQGIRRIRAAGAEVVLMDSQRGPWARHAPNAPAFDAALAAAAREPGVALFSRGRLMDRWSAGGAPPDAMLAADGLHHNDRGYACLAAALAESLLRSAPRITVAR